MTYKMPTTKLIADVATGSGLGLVNNLEVNQTLVLNAIIILGRLVIEFLQNRRAKRKAKKESEQQPETEKS